MVLARCLNVESGASWILHFSSNVENLLRSPAHEISAPPTVQCKWHGIDIRLVQVALSDLSSSTADKVWRRTPPANTPHISS